MNRRSLFKLIGLGVGSCLVGGAGYYHFFLKKLQRRQLVIGGSTIVKRLLEKTTLAFGKKHENLDVLVEGGYSYAGIVALKRESVDLAMTSHDVTIVDNSVDLHSWLIAKEAIGIVVNVGMPITNITLADAQKVFEGVIRNWKQLGGPDQPLTVYSRTNGSTSKLTIENTLLNGNRVYERAVDLPSADELVKKVASDPYGIGFLSLRNFTDGIKPLKINDIEIQNSTVLLGVYPLVRELYLVSRDNSSGIANQFVDYALSNEGQTLLADSGALRVR